MSTPQKERELTTNDIVNICFRFGKKSDEINALSKDLSDLQTKMNDLKNHQDDIQQEFNLKSSAVKGVQAEKNELEEMIKKIFEKPKSDRAFTAPLPTVEEEKKDFNK